MIVDQRPEKFKMYVSLWSRAAVGQLIGQEFGIKLQARSIGKYLTRWGFTPQKPIKHAYEQSPAAVQAWLEGKYLAIEQRAKSEGAEIHWCDETALVNTKVDLINETLIKLLNKQKVYKDEHSVHPVLVGRWKKLSWTAQKACLKAKGALKRQIPVTPTTSNTPRLGDWRWSWHGLKKVGAMNMADRQG